MIWFVCLAIGLACMDRNRDVPNLFVTIWVTATVAMIVGLVQQSRILLANLPAIAAQGEHARFSCWFAVWWRWILGLILGCCVAQQLWQSQSPYRLPENEELFYPLSGYDAVNCLLQVVWIVAVLIVMSAAHSENPQRTPHRSGGVRATVGWVAGILYLGLVIWDLGVLPMLVHCATAAVEATIPAAFQRSEVFFPRSASESYWLFWLALLAAAALFLAVFSLLYRMPSHRRSGALMTGLCLLAPTVFCLWFHESHFPRMSPDMAAAGPTGTWWELALGGLAGAMIVTVGAYRLASYRAGPKIVLDAVLRPMSTPVIHHHSLLNAVLVLTATLVAIAARFRNEMLSSSTDIAYLVVMDGLGVLYLGTLILSVQWCWQSWARRQQDWPQSIGRVAQYDLWAYWILLAWIAAAGAPTLAILTFVGWLVPW